MWNSFLPQWGKEASRFYSAFDPCKEHWDLRQHSLLCRNGKSNFHLSIDSEIHLSKVPRKFPGNWNIIKFTFKKQ